MIKEHSSAGQAETLVILIYAAVIITGLYGFVIDIFHGHWAFVALDLFTGGLVAVIRGIGYFFGWIAY